MEYRKFPQGYVMRLDPGEEIVEQLTALVERENVQSGQRVRPGGGGGCDHRHFQHPGEAVPLPPVPGGL